MRWSARRLARYLARNTAAAARRLGGRLRPRVADLVLMHLARGGWVDHLLLVWLAGPTLGLSAWVWRRWLGSCAFAGYLDEAAGRTGCLIHPLRVGPPDLRRWAFPLVPTVRCDRELRCALLAGRGADARWGWLEASRRGWAALRGEEGGVLFEYLVLTCAVVLPLLAATARVTNLAGNPLFAVVPGGAPEAGGWGFLAGSFVDWYRRILCGVALPIP